MAPSVMFMYRISSPAGDQAGAVERRAIQHQPLFAAAIRRLAVDRARRAPLRREQDIASVRGPDGVAVLLSIEGQLRGSAGFRIHDPDVHGGTVPEYLEGDLPAIGRDARITVIPQVRGKLADLAGAADPRDAVRRLESGGAAGYIDQGAIGGDGKGRVAGLLIRADVLDDRHLASLRHQALRIERYRVQGAAAREHQMTCRQVPREMAALEHDPALSGGNILYDDVRFAPRGLGPG